MFSINKKNVLLITFFCFTQLASKSELYYSNRVVVISIPKAGTHMLTKCVSLFKQPGLSVAYTKEPKASKDDLDKIDKQNQLPPPNNFKGRYFYADVGHLPPLCQHLANPTKGRLFWTHWPHTKKFEDFIKSKTQANFFLIRDPRDVIVSMAHMLQKNPRGTESVDPVSLMWDFIDARQKNYIKWGVEIHEAYPLFYDLGVVGFYKMYLPWLATKKVMTVKFEDLVGSQGDGDDAAQYQTIKNMAQHIGTKLTNAEIQEIQQQLFGGTGTFREGKIGSWRKYFTQEMVTAFKKTPEACQLLITLGYEKNNSWGLDR